MRDKLKKTAVSPLWFPLPEPWAQRLEQAALAVERPINRLIGNTQLNPFYHTGTIAVFLLGIVAATGFYLFLFFQYGFDASYNSVATRIEEPIIARTIRAVHRYASGALVVTSFLHAFRMLFMERFRGPRWLAWISGIAITFILWLDGITGYWLVWDQRAQLITEHFATLFGQAEAGYRLTLLRADLYDNSWPLMFGLFAVHILLFVVVALFFWLHIRHLSRPRWLPEGVWMAGAVLVLLLISLLFPSGMLPPYEFGQLPERLVLDPIFLYYLPLTGTPWANLLWGWMWVATLMAVVLPWYKRRQHKQQVPLVTVIDESCTGCTKCAVDCPYGVFTMVERQDESPHKLLAVADSHKCVGCGICLGSCDDFYAIQLGEQSPTAVRDQVTETIAQAQATYPDRPHKIIFTCKRHLAHKAEPFLAGALHEETAVYVIPLPCSGAIQPSLLPYALSLGAAEAQVVGCPPYDCAHRLGNMLEEQRMTNERVPRLRKRYDHVPITAVWIPPDQFETALPLTQMPKNDDDSDEAPDYLSTRAMFEWLSWRNVLVGVLLLAAVLVAQRWLTGLPYDPTPTPIAQVDLLLANPAGFFLREGSPQLYLPQLAEDETVTVVMEINETAVWQTSYAATDFFALDVTPRHFREAVSPGVYQVRVYWEAPNGRFRGILYNQQVDLQPNQILRIHDLPTSGVNISPVTLDIFMEE